MSDCPFCLIVNGDIPSAKLYEDDQVLAFLDIHPLTTGHTLVIPKVHAAKLHDAPQDAVAAMMTTARMLLPAITQSVGAPDAMLGLHDGPAAGQEVPHAHLHIIPRRSGDGARAVHALFAKPPSTNPDELHDLAGRIQNAL